MICTCSRSADAAVESASAATCAKTTETSESLPSLTSAGVPRRRAGKPSRSRGEQSRRPRAKPEQGLVERPDELGSVAVEQRLDERSTERVANTALCTVGAQVFEELGARLAVFADEHRDPHGRRPRPVLTTEERRQRIANL